MSRKPKRDAEAVKAYCREYYQIHKHRLKDKNKTYRLERAAHIRKSRREYYLKNKLEKARPKRHYQKTSISKEQLNIRHFEPIDGFVLTF
jgi:hypothetical protein